MFRRALTALSAAWSRFSLARLLWSVGDTLGTFFLTGFGYLAVAVLISPRAEIKADLPAVVRDAVVDPKPFPIAVVAVLVFFSSVVTNYAELSEQERRQRPPVVLWRMPKRRPGVNGAASQQPCRSVTDSAGRSDA